MSTRSRAGFAWPHRGRLRTSSPRVRASRALRNDESIRPWIAQLTRRLCIDRLRAGGREGVVDPSDIEIADPDETLARLDEAMTVRAGLDAVGDMCREMLDRFFCRDESYRVIGEALDLPSGTIASRISRCLTKLRLELGKILTARAV
jgi:RNA polymerase sigma factor (sigma-70 family)